MRRVLIYSITVVLAIFLCSCKQVRDIKAFTEAGYRLEGVADVKLNGIDLRERLQKRGRLSNAEHDSLLTAISGNTLTATATLGLHVHLKDTSEIRTLTITKLKWLFLVDGKEALTGTITKTMVLHEGLNSLPIETPIRLTEVDGNPNYEGLSHVINLISQKKNIRQSITFKIKPTIKTPLGNIETPEYITVSKPPQNSAEVI